MPTVAELFARALAHHQAGQLAAAEQTCRHILDVDAGHADAWHLLGLIASRSGNTAAAIEFFQRAIAQNSQLAEACYNLGCVLHELGRLDEAAAAYARAAELRPDFAEAHNNLATAFKAQGKLADAVESFHRALTLRPTYAEAHSNLGNAYREQRQFEEAINCYHRALELRPDLMEARINLAGALKALGRPDEAIDSYRQALDRNPDYVEAQNNLGNALQEQGKLNEAVAWYVRAIALRPNYAEAHRNLGNALMRQGKLADAVAAYQRSLAIQPQEAGALNNLGIALLAQGNQEQAAACFRRALEIRPDYCEAQINWGNACQELGDLDQAAGHYQRAIELSPDSAEAYNNLGNVLKDQGQVNEAIGCFRRAVQLKPDFAVADSNLVYTLQFSPDYDAAAILAEHRRWNNQHAEPLARSIRPHANDRSSDRRLRVGYVSPDFYNHCQSFFMVPLFSLHDHQAFEIVCYCDVTRPDAITDLLRSKADAWRNIVGATDDAVAEQIRADRVDILLDLSMHMARGRPLLFARQPAPVQACWFAYPGTTGLTAIDYRLTDPYLDPPDQSDRFYSEISIRLADTFWCYDPLTREPPVNPPPAMDNGYITFGSLNNYCKVNAPLLKLWARVLRTVPQSRLLLLAGEGSHRQRTLDLLAAEGVAPERVEFAERRPRQQYLELYHRIDIGLDTLPYNGHVTSLDSFWMGVPVVTLVGQTVAGRAGLSQLTNLGLLDLIAHTADEYVQIAAALARDMARLSHLRGSLRQRMEQSPLMDTPRFARSIEAAYRTMWRQWCAGPGGSAP